MGKQTTKKARQAPPLSADRLRAGWPGSAGTRIHLARPEDAEAADALMATTGDQARIVPVPRSAIEDGTAAPTMLAGLGASNTKAYYDAAAVAFTDRPMNEALTTVSRHVAERDPAARRRRT
ncbi:hypothetical protein J7F02_31500 [Streptomyces sp. ISL-112]|uniref:hypothetical protein n=1 Tax=unclassified Streptomyces TaxID=2593676 RepID=UPI001BEA7E95|nr:MULTISPECIES: hypothetical protein [unclassified Streptomyces]MBT2430006.1 hypothetical protein [Streptomyces sp. ISL-112]MBT2461466.1 hypothetical protein [Streptomyces sp. ISL-63]